MTTYVRFTETNDSEGEVWNFWLPVEGNERELDVLADYLEEYDSDGFELDLSKAVSRGHVDILVEEASWDDDGYMPAHQMLKGSLALPELDEKYPEDWFYKGEIAKYFR